MKAENKTPLVVVQVDTPYISMSELSKRMDISISTVRRLIETGFIQIEKREGERGSVFVNFADLAFRAMMNSKTVQEYLKTANRQNPSNNKG